MGCLFLTKSDFMRHEMLMWRLPGIFIQTHIYTFMSTKTHVDNMCDKGHKLSLSPGCLLIVTLHLLDVPSTPFRS